MDVYVDDLLVIGSDINMIIKFKKVMATRFEMSDLGKLRYCHRIEVTQREDGIILSQQRYETKILKEVELKGCNATHMPMDIGLNLSKAIYEEGIDERNYLKSIGCLRYVIHTRPDLAYSVGDLSRYMYAPKSHTEQL